MNTQTIATVDIHISTHAWVPILKSCMSTQIYLESVVTGLSFAIEEHFFGGAG